jgi:3-hydroxyisobutyrate dehydrogenase-like beta-hydroxyacid dehydrogenase
MAASADPSCPSIALVGFGEAGSVFASAGNWAGKARGWDILPERREAMAGCGVEAQPGPAEALAGAQLVLSLVTADAALSVAEDYAPYLEEGAIWCDMNSVAPQTKQKAAAAVEHHGGSYVDIAVMAPVNPPALHVPLFISGPEAEQAKRLLGGAGFSNTRMAGSEVGRASAIKMIRSVMVKGLEALTDECAAAARAAGVYDEVMASLDASERGWNWTQKAEYNRERMETHGTRRAAEMEQVAATLRALGVDPLMTEAAVIRQRRAAGKKQDTDRKSAA